MKRADEKFNFTSDTQHQLYELMNARCKALSSRNMEMLKQLYTKDSTEPDWLGQISFPTLEEWPAKYSISNIEHITVVGKDAAASYSIFFWNDYKSDRQTVDVLYEMENGSWKIDAVNIR